MISKNLEGPYFDLVEDLRAQINHKIANMCKEIFHFEKDIQLKNCIKVNFDLLVVNMILNLDPGNHPLVGALQNEVYHGENAAKKENIELENKRNADLLKQAKRDESGSGSNSGEAPSSSTSDSGDAP